MGLVHKISTPPEYTSTGIGEEASVWGGPVFSQQLLWIGWIVLNTSMGSVGFGKNLDEHDILFDCSWNDGYLQNYLGS